MTARRVLATLFCLLPVLASGSAQRVHAVAAQACELSASRLVSPPVVRLDGDVAVQLRVQASCPDESLDRHFVLALGPWATSAEATLVRQAASAFLAALASPASQISLVLGHAYPPLVVPWTDDDAVLAAALAAYGPAAYGSDAATLLDAASKRFYAPDAPAGRGHIVLVSHSGMRPATPEGLFNASFDARSAGVWLSAVCVGTGCVNVPRAEQLSAPTLSDVAPILTAIARRPARLELDQLVVRDELGGETAYVPGSAVPAATRIGETVYEQGAPLHRRGFLEWTIDQETQGWNARYRLRPTLVGPVATHTRLVVEALDTRGSWLRTEVGPDAITVLSPPPAPATCRLYGQAEAHGPVLLGASVPITVSLLAECPPQPQQADVVILIDRSWSTQGQPLARLVQAGRDFVRQLDLGLIRAAVVAYNDVPEVRQPFTQNREQLLAAFEGLVAAGNTNPRDAIDRARQLLADRRPGALPVIVLFYDGYLTVDPTPAVEWARMEGVRIATICVRSGTTCAAGVASPPEYAVEAAQPADLAAYWQQFVPSLVERSLEEVVVSQIPSAALPFDHGAIPPAIDVPTVLADGRLRWTRSGLLRPFIVLRYPLRASAVGRWPIAEGLEVGWRERGGAVGAARLSIPELDVLAPPGEGPCRLVTAERYAEPSVVTLGAAFTVTSKVDLECPPADLPLQVLFVIDHSASMGAGSGRLEAVRRAVRSMLTAPTSQQWLFGAVAFNDDVTEWVGVTENRQSVLDLVDRLRAGGGTNIGAAIRRGGELLAEAAAEVPQVMIVLTDGINATGSGPVLAAASEVKASGVIVVAVCAGGECDPALPEAASDPSYYFAVPDPESLVDLFGQLTRELIRSVTLLALEEQIGPGLELAGLLPQPPAAEITDLVVRWSFNRLPVGGVSLTHALVPRRLGHLPVARWTRLDYATLGQGGQVESGYSYLPVPAIEVVGDPTPSPSLPTLAPPPAQTATPTPATGTAIPLPQRVAHLPFLVRR